MKKKDYRRRCEKVSLSKCDGVCRTYNPIQLQYAYVLQDMPEIESFRANVLMEGLAEGDYTSDFFCKKTDGDYMVRECVYRTMLTKPKTAKLLEESRQYWLRHGVIDWGIVINAEE